MQWHPKGFEGLKARWDTLQTLQGRLVKSVGAQTGWRLAAVPISLVNVTVVTRNLSLTGYGQLTTALAFYGIFSIVADFGVNSVVIKLASTGGEGLHRLVNTSVGLSLIYAFPGGAALIFVGWKIYSGPDFPLLRESLIVYAAGFIAACVGASLRPLFQQELRLSWTSAAEFAVAAFCLAGYGATARFELYPIWYFYVQGFGPVIGLAVLMLALRRFKLRPLFDRKTVANLFKMALPVGVASLIASVYLRADTFMLTILASQNVVGEYGLAYRVIGPISVISVYVASTLYPQLARLKSEDVFRYGQALTRSILGVIALGALLSILGCIVSRDLILLISGQKFVGAVLPLEVLFISLLPSFVNGLLGGVLVLMNRERMLLVISSACLLLNVGVNLIAIPAWGASGAAVVQLLSELLATTACFISIFRELDLPRLRRGTTVLVGSVILMLALNFLTNRIVDSLAAAVVVRLIILSVVACGGFCGAAYRLGLLKYLRD